MKFNLYKRLSHRLIILNILIILFFSLTTRSIANEQTHCDKITFEKNKPNSINEFKVEIFKNKKWTKNSIGILIGNTRVIPEKFKKRYSGQISIKLQNKKKCKFLARIRQNGDLKDHISLYGNSIKQSLDIHLKEKNIQGITKFKLFLDGTRGISDDEIFLTELLRELKFISPRTFYIEAHVNGIRSKMLLQEKTEKEMLEYNKRVESPIFEGDERLMLKSTEKFVNNNLSNDEIGMLEDIEKSIRVILGRQTNNQWSEKSLIHSEISLRALSNLNRSYIQFQNSFKNEFNNFIYYQYNFDNKNLGQNIEENIIKLDIYNLILTTTNAWHGLSANNRKFYWNKIENYFEPIYYDGNVNIFSNDNIKLSLPFSNHINKSIIEFEKYLENLNIDNFKKKLSYRALNYDNKKIINKLEIIKYNLDKIKKSINHYDTKLIDLNKKIKFDQEMVKKFAEHRKKIYPKTNFIFNEQKNKADENMSFLSCLNLSKCNEIKLNIIEQSELLSGKSNQNNFENIYLGFYPNLKNEFSYEKYRFDQIDFYYSKGIEFKFDKEKKEFNIYQKIPEARAFFLKSKIKNLDINFYGNENFTNLKFLPFDLKGLTGCLTIVNSEVDNINLSSNNSNCEDSINFINVKGKINKINIKNSYLDALDLDFSELEINQINVNNAGNDCLDVSFGIYKFNDLDLFECNDKGISIGEKSKVNTQKAKIENVNIGIASKDSSIANFNKIYLNNLDTCLMAYNKKQEFNGGTINSNFLQCNNFITKLKKDNNSKIIINKDVF